MRAYLYCRTLPRRPPILSLYRMPRMTHQVQNAHSRYITSVTCGTAIRLLPYTCVVYVYVHPYVHTYVLSCSFSGSTWQHTVCTIYPQYSGPRANTLNYVSTYIHIFVYVQCILLRLVLRLPVCTTIDVHISCPFVTVAVDPLGKSPRSKKGM